MEIDFRTAREALIYEIGIKTGLLQREEELRTKTKDSSSSTAVEIFMNW